MLEVFILLAFQQRFSNDVKDDEKNWLVCDDFTIRN